ncbi:ABC ATP-binding isoform 1 [Chlorella sorokiniana]|uniref:ABC ATP-binding isoform 1 n=1 Tax=Chlorella sorokiniana TaxID=3076 RepID=A0A2P6U0J2_CHLSO|nr:ABC ATP-binding isoform 1 [Chlorella sorokiniana]|eukprot:PRW59820.1 ABC ATP-binding isoform 1 [Chlorella sorokiniana]
MDLSPLKGGEGPPPAGLAHHAGGPRPLDIEFRGIKYVVKDRATGKPLEILKGVSGKVEACRLMVIMGSSGAGKTTLLDILANNLWGSCTVEGQVLVNGAERKPREFSQVSCYVLQRDVLLSSSTVREAITTSALLKLPRSMPAAEKVARVDGILKDLDLEGCQHTLIGDEMLHMKGISGGQRRRVSVGIELVKSPRTLFLDEPTSGLDSEMAVSLIDTLVQLARQDRTVCTTIDQPNSIITAKFDDFMLLHAGSTVYFGRWEGAVDYFAAHGCPCPQYTNTTDYALSLMKGKGDELVTAWAAQDEQRRQCSADVEAGSGNHTVEETPAPGSKLCGMLAVPCGGASGVQQRQQQEQRQQQQGQQQQQQQQQQRQQGGGVQPVARQSSQLQLVPSVPWWFQVWVLSKRMFRQWIRNPAMLISEISQYAFMAIFVGLVWLQVNDSLATGPNDRAASIWFSMAVMSFTPAYTAAVVWDKDRLLLRRESQTDMYDVTAWFAARTLTLLPFEMVQCVAFCVVAYWMVGYAAIFLNFVVFTAAFILFQLVSETVGEMSAVVTGSSTYAVLILTFVLLFLLSFSGFLVSDVPVYFRWIAKESWLPEGG